MEEIHKTAHNSIAERLPKSHKTQLKFDIIFGAQTSVLLPNGSAEPLFYKCLETLRTFFY